MQYTTQQQQEFREEFKRRQKRQYLIGLPILALIILKIVFRTSGTGGGLWQFLSSDAVWPVIFVFIAGAIAFSFKNWRCPACNKYLGRSIEPNFCPRCGISLQQEA
jgi:hypothetical protein